MRNKMKRAAALVLAGTIIIASMAGAGWWKNAIASDGGEAVTINGAKILNGAAHEGSVQDEESATIMGDEVELVYDSTLGSKVLNLKGGTYGSGYLVLPENLYNNVTEGFTLSMMVNIASSAENFTRLFQSSSIRFGTGDTFWYDAPDISFDLNNTLDSFRASVYVGKETHTSDDGSHRTMFYPQAQQNRGQWVRMTVIVSENEIAFYYNGVKSVISGGDNLTQVLAALFDEGEQNIQSYIYNSIGHSVYQDNDVKAKFDDITFYSRALTESEALASDMPSDMEYKWTFEDGYVIMAQDDSVDSGSDVYTDGTSLGKINELSQTSFDGTVNVEILTDTQGRFFINGFKNGDCVIEASMLGINTTDTDFTSGMTYVNGSLNVTEVRDTYALTAGGNSEAEDYCREMSFRLKKDEKEMTVAVRIYDDGIAYKYKVDGTGTAEITGEQSEYVLPDNAVTWAFNQTNVTYEGTFVKRTMSVIKNLDAMLSTPVLASVDSDKYWVLLTEAAVFSQDEQYCSSYFSTEADSKNLKYIFGNKQTDNVTMTYPFETPWRAAIITDNLNDLANSDLVSNLNPESVIEDTSWIKAGKAAWSWWSTNGDNPIEYSTQKNYIDFASENGWDYVCLDYGWVLWDNYEEKVAELCDYGAEKGIRILLWYGVNNTGHASSGAYPKYSLLDEATIKNEFEKIADLGVAGVKVDYYESDNQLAMSQMNDVAEIAADNKLVVVFHGCTMPKGEERTYPNILSYEAVYGAEYYKWRAEPSVENCLTYLFTRNVTGPMDFTPTITQVSNISATAGFMLAETVVFESGIQHFAQSAYVLQGYSGLAFANDVAVKWDETILAEGYPGEYNTVARRSGEDWYVGAMTSEERITDISLGFLDEGQYTAYIYKDSEDGTKVILEEKAVTNADVLKLKLAENGGAAVKITKNTMKTGTSYDNIAYYEAEDGQVTGTAIVENNQYASGLKFVGWIGNGGDNAVAFTDVTAGTAGTYSLEVFFTSGEQRDLYITINDSETYKLADLISNKGDWVAVASVTLNITLQEGQNTIKLYNGNAVAPSIDRIGIVKTDGQADSTVKDENNSADTGENSDGNSGGNIDGDVQTGDTARGIIYIQILLAVSAMAVYGIIVLRRKFN